MTFSPKVWGDVLRRLQDEIPDFAFDAWIAPLAVKTTDDLVLLGCPNTFHRDRVRKQYGDQILASWRALRSVGDGEERAESPLPRIEFLTMADFGTAAGIELDVQVPKRVAKAIPASVARTAVGHAVDAAPRYDGRGAGVGPATEPVRGRTPQRAAAAAMLRAVPRARGGVPPSARSHRGARDVPTAQIDGALARGDDPARAQPELPFSFESFIVGPCNALAREAALALARRRQRSLNQLYLGGDTGMGKTHLARATAVEARRHAGQFASPSARSNASRVVYTSAEEFTSEFVSAMRLGQSEEWKRRYRSPIGLLIVEDVQFLSGRTKTQLELFHTVQHVLDAGGSVLLTGDQAPRDLVGLDERMRDQVGRGFVAELEMPDALVRRHILRAKAAAGGVHLPPDCLDLMVDASTGNVRDIESVLIQVVTTASLLGRSIDLDLTREAIDLKTGARSTLDRKTIAPSEIVRIVAAFFGKRPDALASRSRRRDVLIPRQLAMYLAHRYTDASFTEIGRALGRDHPAVRNAIERIERLVLENAPLRYQIEALSERIDQTRKDGEASSEPS